MWDMSMPIAGPLYAQRVQQSGGYDMLSSGILGNQELMNNA
jgi:hypothetical protein